MLLLLLRPLCLTLGLIIGLHLQQHNNAFG